MPIPIYKPAPPPFKLVGDRVPIHLEWPPRGVSHATDNILLINVIPLQRHTSHLSRTRPRLGRVQVRGDCPTETILLFLWLYTHQKFKSMSLFVSVFLGMSVGSFIASVKD